MKEKKERPEEGSKARIGSQLDTSFSLQVVLEEKLPPHNRFSLEAKGLIFCTLC